MEKIKAFERWLINKTIAPLSESSAYKYSRAVNSISKDMIKEGVIERNIYNIDTYEELLSTIKRIKSNGFFSYKNNKGHNMYSCALDHYIDFFRGK